MVNDSSKISYDGDFDSKAKSPKTTSINYIKQFARVYSATKGVEFSYLILN